MTTRTLSGAILMALVWAFVWALPGGVIEAIDNVAPSAHWFTRQIDMWPQTLGQPGLLAGLVYAVLLMTTEGRRRFAAVARSRAVAWGALAGVGVGAFIVWGTATGLAEPLPLAVGVVGYAALMGAASGIASVVVFRYADHKLAPAT